MTGIETPCVKICVIDQGSGLCTGCGRNLPEIARWGSFSSEERRRIMIDLPQRLARLRLPQAANVTAKSS